MYTDRFHAAESQTVRLYFRNYVSNVLTNLTSPSCTIRLRGGTSTIATPVIVNESTGVYYVDWAIPCLTNTDSPKYNASFPGPGYYQDIWSDGVTSWPQDFYVEREDYPNSLASVNEPMQFTHELLTPRMEIGARDFITWRLTENNGRLIPGESLYPDGKIQIFYGDQVIKNYDSFVHKEDREIYRYYLDTTSLKNGIYKLQAKFEIPSTNSDSKASVTTGKSLAGGFSPSINALLDITVDGVQRTISFPTTSTKATIEGATVSNPTALNFPASANDVFIVDVDGTEKRVELVNTTVARSLANIVAELNGTLPSDWTGLTCAAPIVTSSLNSITFTNLNNTTLTVNVDDVPFTVQFNNPTNIAAVVSQINAAYAGTIAIASGGILALAKIGTSTIQKIEIIGGTAVTILGFVEGQYDESTHSISPATASVSGAAIKLTGSAAGTLRVLSGNEGSTANASLGFASLGTSSTGVTALPASITGSGAIYPLSVVNPTAASVQSTVDLSTFSASTSYPYNTTLNGLTLTVTVDGGSPTNVTFTDVTSPAAITSIYSYGTYNVNGLSLSFYNDVTLITVNFTGTNPLAITDIIAQINTLIGTGAIADAWNGHLRIRRTSTSGYIKVMAGTAATILGFNTAAVTSSPEVFYQNDQAYASGSDLRADPYVNSWELTDIVSKINTVHGSTIASTNVNKLVITSPTMPPGTSTIAISGAANALLYLTTSSTGVAGQNYNLKFTYPSLVSETITFDDGVYSLQDFINEINTQATAAVASEVSGQIKISTVATGATSTLVISESARVALGLATGPVTGSVATSSEITGTTVTLPVSFVSGGHAKLYVSWTDGTSTVTSLVNLIGITTLTNVATAINSAMGGNVTATATGTNTLRLEAALTGTSYTVGIGSQNDGSTANVVLGYSVDGASSTGTTGQPYTIDQIIERINAGLGGYEVADNVSNFIRLRSINSGGAAYVQIGNSTTANIVNDWSLSKGIYYGASSTQIAQTVISPKLTFVIGE